jgi:hypothetical protein
MIQKYESGERFSDLQNAAFDDANERVTAHVLKSMPAYQRWFDLAKSDPVDDSGIIAGDNG